MYILISDQLMCVFVLSIYRNLQKKPVRHMEHHNYVITRLHNLQDCITYLIIVK